MVGSLYVDDCSYYWVFHTPISPGWITSEDTRERLEKAARGQNEISEEIREQLRQDVHSRSERKLNSRSGTF